MLDISTPNVSYKIGLVQADGSLSSNTRNRGKLQIELKADDIELLERLKAEVVPAYARLRTRTRNTNFKEGHSSAILSVYNKEFRDFLKNNGVPIGKKCFIISPPPGISEVDYLRGLLDGDGSVGFTAKGVPFVGLCTSSEFIADFLVGFVKQRFNYHKVCNRNKRDGSFQCYILETNSSIACKGCLL